MQPVCTASCLLPVPDQAPPPPVSKVVLPLSVVLHPAVQRDLAAAVPLVEAPLALVHVAVGGGVGAAAVPQLSQRLALARVIAVRSLLKAASTCGADTGSQHLAHALEPNM